MTLRLYNWDSKLRSTWVLCQIVWSTQSCRELLDPHTIFSLRRRRKRIQSTITTADIKAGNPQLALLASVWDDPKVFEGNSPF
jgi:hypothetical protein